MIYLVLCILSATLLVVIFRYFAHHKVQVSQAIFVNYVVCTLLGVVFLPGAYTQLTATGFSGPWLWVAVLAGFLYYVTFFLIAESTRTVGITITSVAQKVSLVIPVAASLLLWRTSDKPLGLTTWAGLVLALAAVALASWRKNTKTGKAERPGHLGKLAWLLPVIVFINAGIADTLINFANFRYLSPELESAFTLAVFGTAAILGAITQFYQITAGKTQLSWRSLPAGLILGIPNLLSLVFLLKTLTAFGNNGALVYPLVNIGVILLAAVAGILLFHEKLLKINWAGMALALLALGLLLMNAGA